MLPLYFVRRFGAASVKIKRSIGDAAIRISTFRYMIHFVQNLCDHTFIVLKLYSVLIGHLYDIKPVGISHNNHYPVNCVRIAWQKHSSFRLPPSFIN